MRRTHTKSRLGCRDCKKRRIKCDEGRPSCAHCISSGRSCSFSQLYEPNLPALKPPSAATPASTSPALPTPVEAPASSTQQSSLSGRHRGNESVLPSNGISGGLGTVQALGVGSPSYSLHHFELLHHFSAVLSKPLVIDSAHTTGFADLAVRQASTCSFLMDELLALSAVHKSTTLPESEKDAIEALRNEAAVLQGRAISSYRTVQDGIEGSSHQPGPGLGSSGSSSNAANTGGSAYETHYLNAFLFSSLVGQHSLFDTFSPSPYDDADLLLDRFLRCVRLHRGIGAVSQSARPTIGAQVSAALGTKLEDTPSRAEEVAHEAFRMVAECDRLSQRLERFEDRHQEPEDGQACQNAVGILSSMFHQYGSCRDASSTRLYLLRVVHEWPVRLSDQYIRLLEQRKKEALVVLVYYGMLLHQARFYWPIREGGRYLVNLMTVALGDTWADWVVYPNQQIADDAGLGE